MNMSNYTKIALFFIVIGVGGGAFIVTTSNNLNDFRTREYETVIADATGLSTRSKIYQAGVLVGRIKGITLAEDEALLRIAILKDVPVRKDAVITRKSSSILGTSILTLEPGNPSSPIIQPGGRLASAKEREDMNAVMGSVHDLSGQISQLLADFQQNQLAMLAISLETFNSIAQKLDANSDAELERISRILESFAMITGEISQGRGNVGQAIYDDKLYESLLSTMQRIEVAVIKLQDTLDTVNDVASSAGTVIDNANIIVERATGIGVQVDTFGRYYTMANQAQAGAAIIVVPTTNDRWYRLGVSSVPNGYSTRTVTQTYDSSGGLTNTQDTTETKYSVFVVDAELARSVGLFTIRGGLIENTGGIGFDVRPFNWIGVSGEVFDIKTGEPPNLRGSMTIYPFFDPDSDKPWNWLYLKGGISNSLSADRDFFVGGGMRFHDREIKGLIGLLPALN